MNNLSKIINYLGKNIEQQYTMHELSKILKIPYATFYRNIKNNPNLLNTKTIGKSKVITLNIQNPILKSYLAISSDEETKEFLKKQPVLNILTSEINTKDTILLFGSYAKGTETKKSDIDLLIINKDGNKSISFEKYETIYSIKINPIFITKKEFISMIFEKSENVGKQALKNHIILKYPDIFWENVINDFLQRRI